MEALLPHMLWMAACTFFASEPQTVLRSAGLGSVLTAARRHAGGVARTLAERASRERMSVDLMVVEKRVVRCKNHDCRFKRSKAKLVGERAKRSEAGPKERLEVRR
jgi:hypothetical protein